MCWCLSIIQLLAVTLFPAQHFMDYICHALFSLRRRFIQ